MKFSEFVNEEKTKSEKYQAFFKMMLKKFGVDSPSELSDEKKKEFYDAVDAGWEGEDEEEETNEAYTKSIGHKQTQEAIDRLVRQLDPKSNLCKGISKGADNVVPEFKEMKKLIDQIEDIWGEVEYTIGMNE